MESLSTELKLAKGNSTLGPELQLILRVPDKSFLFNRFQVDLVRTHHHIVNSLQQICQFCFFGGTLNNIGAINSH